jgi:hypothetical protein
VCPIFFLCVAHATTFFFTVIPCIFPPGVPQFEACLADVYVSVILESFKGRFIVTPGDAVEGILCPFFLVNDVFLQIPIQEL